eukprot:Skav219238  [mRNA]  locus=scaffold1242:39448:40584:+ [translate_table: standard]
MNLLAENQDCPAFIRKLLKQRISTLEPDSRNIKPLVPRKKPPNMGHTKVLIKGLKTIRMDVTVPYEDRIFKAL